MDDISNALNGFLDSTAEPAHPSAGGVNRGAPLRRTGSATDSGSQAHDDGGEAIAEPAVPVSRRGGADGDARPSNRAGIRPASQSGVDLKGWPCLPVIGLFGEPPQP